MTRCTKCVLPDTIPNIHFDDDGVCNYCIEFDKNKNNVKIDYNKKKNTGKILFIRPKPKERKRNPSMMFLSR